MATQTTVTLVDDIDGSAASETVAFSFDGHHYEIDLSDKNAKRFRDSLANYVGAARPAEEPARRRGPGRPRGSRTTRSGGRGAVDREQTTAIRDWARKNGFAVSDRGRLSAGVLEAFEAAH
ncbi:Lsr2 family protein [Nakamurella silvestris]|nr:Lsr2 family protein [Nakamurella silvestris]